MTDECNGPENPLQVHNHHQSLRLYNYSYYELYNHLWPVLSNSKWTTEIVTCVKVIVYVYTDYEIAKGFPIVIFINSKHDFWLLFCNQLYWNTCNPQQQHTIFNSEVLKWVLSLFKYSKPISALPKESGPDILVNGSTRQELFRLVKRLTMKTTSLTRTLCMHCGD